MGPSYHGLCFDFTQQRETQAFPGGEGVGWDFKVFLWGREGFVCVFLVKVFFRFWVNKAH